MIHKPIVFYIVHKDGRYLSGNAWLAGLAMATRYVTLGCAKAVAESEGAEVLRYHATSVPWREV